MAMEKNEMENSLLYPITAHAILFLLFEHMIFVDICHRPVLRISFKDER